MKLYETDSEPPPNMAEKLGQPTTPKVRAPTGSRNIPWNDGISWLGRRNYIRVGGQRHQHRPLCLPVGGLILY